MAKTVLITGARKGIGRDLAEHYLVEGHTVIGCSRSPSDLEHPAYHDYTVDVADDAGVQALMRSVRRNHETVDVLINNAGIASMNAAVLTPLSTVERIFQTNVFGTFLFCREVGKLMIKARRGRIINFATVATPLRLEGEAAYAASKAAVENFTQVLAKELGGYGITVNAIGPTPVKTDLIRGVADDKIDRLLERQCINRIGEYRDIRNVVDFFAADESDFVTGQVVYLGGVF